MGCTAFVPAPRTYCWKAKPSITVVKASAKSNNNQDTLPTNDTDINNDSLSHWSSSPERYAQRLGLTMAQLEAERAAHQDACKTLHQQLSSLSSHDDDKDGNLGRHKHELICQHRYQHGKHAFVCRHCWCYRPICLCQHPIVPAKKIKLPTCVSQFILWTHHQEWGSISNSGSLLPLMLDHTVMLLKGLPSHNEQLQDLLLHAQQNPQHKVVVLWPDNHHHHHHHHHHEPRDQTDSTTSISSSSRQEWGQVQDMIFHSPQSHQHQKVETVTLLAVEGTWRTARRMVSKLPPHVIRVALPPSALFWQQQQQYTAETNDDHDDNHDSTTTTTTTTSQQMPPPPFNSILAPLRQQVGGSHNNVCTVEAVVAALVALGMSQTDGTRILNLVQQKVDLTRRYQGKQQHR